LSGVIAEWIPGAFDPAYDPSAPQANPFGAGLTECQPKTRFPLGLAAATSAGGLRSRRSVDPNLQVRDWIEPLAECGASSNDTRTAGIRQGTARYICMAVP
jgi:hypothetical protein